jgi:hypothetical protein
MICGKFFFLLESQAFWDDNFTPEQVFGSAVSSRFSS